MGVGGELGVVSARRSARPHISAGAPQLAHRDYLFFYEKSLRARAGKKMLSALTVERAVERGGVMKLLGRKPGDKAGVQTIVLIKPTGYDGFVADPDERGAFVGTLDLALDRENDVFSYYTATIRHPMRCPVVVIASCTAKQIRKHFDDDLAVVRESGAMYDAVTKAYVDAFPPSRNAWIGNILDGTKEAEHALHSTPDMLLSKATDWTPSGNVRSLRCLTIFRHPRLRSIRDLRGSDVAMLRAAKGDVLRALHERYGTREDELRLYFHYHPTFWHLHMHITHWSQTRSTETDRAHLLDDVIDNLSLDGNYYARRALTTKVPRDGALHRGFKAL